MKSIIKIPLLIAALFTLIFAAFFIFEVNKLNAKLSDNLVESVDFNQVQDGTYTGFFDVKFIKAEVELTMNDGKLIDLKLLKHEHGKDRSAERIIMKIINEQTLEVGVVTGASKSSHVIVKAVEIAMRKGLKDLDQ